MSQATIKHIDDDSIAYEMGLEPGDCIVNINNMPVNDVLDYKFLTSDDCLTVEVLKKNGDTEIIEVQTDYEDLGITFENSLLDAPKSCQNKCIFCFIDQLPKGMRQTVYFKDDDARLSFLQGNYITLTNLSDADIDRIVRMRISPVNVSVHCTDPELRIMMLGNKKAGRVLEIMQRLADNHITMNAQIVLCRGINDGKNLDKTIGDLAGLYPYVNSVSVVPVGISAYRQGLYPLDAYDKSSSDAVIAQVQRWQNDLLSTRDSRIVFIADEFYLLTGKDIPSWEKYEGFPQIENGVGLIASMQNEFELAISNIRTAPKKRNASIITGELAYGFIKGMCDRLAQDYPCVSVNVYAIKNNFFGGAVSVSGLLCGCDIIGQLAGKTLGDKVFIPKSMLRAGEDIFLDDVTLEALQDRLGVTITPVENDGYDFVEKILDIELL